MLINLLGQSPVYILANQMLALCSISMNVISTGISRVLSGRPSFLVKGLACQIISIDGGGGGLKDNPPPSKSNAVVSFVSMFSRDPQRMKAWV